MCTHLLTLSLSHLLTLDLSLSLTLTHSLTHCSLTHSLAHANSLTHSHSFTLTHLLTSFTHTRSLSRPLTRTLTLATRVHACSHSDSESAREFRSTEAEDEFRVISQVIALIILLTEVTLMTLIVILFEIIL
jgi:hypothetical protein